LFVKGFKKKCLRRFEKRSVFETVSKKGHGFFPGIILKENYEAMKNNVLITKETKCAFPGFMIIKPGIY
jgi:hypothetical protein